MPEIREVEFESLGYGNSVRLRAKDWVRIGQKEYIFEVVFHYARKEFGLDISYKDYERLEFKGTKYERPSEWGTWDCFSKNLNEVFTCLERTYGVKAKITGITPQELQRRARVSYEEAIAPMPREITMFDIIEGNSDKVLKDMLATLPRFCTMANVGKIGGEGEEYAKEKCVNILKNVINDLELHISNEDWSYHLKEGKLKVEFTKMINNLYEYHSYECEEAWNVEPKEPRKKELTEGERLGETIWKELIEAPRAVAINALGDINARKFESMRCKDAIKAFLTTYSENMKKIVQQLR